jgi:hypothetical protein
MSVLEQTHLRAGLRKWVELALVGTDAETKVIFAQQGRGGRPERPYADITVDSTAGVGRDERQPIDGLGDRKIVGPRVATVTIMVAGPDAIGLAEQVRDALWREDVLRLLRLEGVSFYNADPVQNGTVELESGLEQRGIFSARFGYRSAQTEHVGWIEDAEMVGSLEDQAGEELVSTELWVPESPP